MFYIKHLTFSIIILSSFMCTNSYAAAAGMHVVLANKWLEVQEKKYSDEDKAAFIVGTLFPDIRYLGTVKRSSTHEENINNKVIKNTKNMFIAGKRLHAFVDIEREIFAEKYGIYNHTPGKTYKQKVKFLKLLEDEIIWNKFNQLKTVEQLNYPLFVEEKNQNVSSLELMSWRMVLKYYFARKPSETFLDSKTAIEKLSLRIAAKDLDDMLPTLRSLSLDPIFIDYTNSLVSHMEELFKKT